MADRAGAVMFKGNPITLGGPEIKPGGDAPDFTAVDNGLQTVKLSQARGKVVVLTAVPSLDTPVCDTETRKFNTEAGKLGAGVEVWTISMDLPFAQKRWCGAFGVDKVKMLSDHKDGSFGAGYGTLIQELRIESRAIFVLDKNNKVVHAEYVPEGADHPDYDAALAATRAAGAAGAA
jgi:thioredoxin-dependent peroxiredoxin